MCCLNGYDAVRVRYDQNGQCALIIRGHGAARHCEVHGGSPLALRFAESCVSRVLFWDFMSKCVALVIICTQRKGSGGIASHVKGHTTGQRQLPRARRCGHYKYGVDTFSSLPRLQWDSSLKMWLCCTSKPPHTKDGISVITVNGSAARTNFHSCIVIKCVCCLRFRLLVIHSTRMNLTRMELDTLTMTCSSVAVLVAFRLSALVSLNFTQAWEGHSLYLPTPNVNTLIFKQIMRQLRCLVEEVWMASKPPLSIDLCRYMWNGVLVFVVVETMCWPQPMLFRSTYTGPFEK